ncbi:FG-GAP-like repeat-containing protein [Streptomyces poriferorum]|uniref:FG-GAP-like repeat-containing protein n=1 Tax=Streptomyces poriferorum TaxID=2798799 RepID=A0ABY9IJX1_9ACTN|nr:MULTISPECIES: FG-GAP-like repeat-containing protein [unclassified Streptomyces]MDP5317328.1 FG-GAP-like repeat-containing protein [Streptomyces sp. Alt4]WLQ55583.1 FG-GAP-like repeat-containing protein [Streptomyces sp. Alt2]
MIEAPAQAAVGTASTDTAFSFAARLDIGNGMRGCTAALVAPQWLAAAASCFSDDPASEEVAAGAPKWKTTATIGRQDLTSVEGQVREVVELIPREGRDLVMARLSAPTAGIVPISLATTAPIAGAELQVAGFGRTKDEWAPTKLHTAVFKVDSIADETLDISGKSPTDAICAGDSGAPIVRTKSGGGYELVALASRSWQGGCFGSEETRTDAIAARLDNVVGGNQISSGTTLMPGDSLTSNSARLTMQPDGNLIVISNAGATLWSTKTAGNPGATARFTAQGNFTVLAADGTTVLWESNTSAPGGKAVLQNRGNFVIYNSSNQSQWAAGTEVRHDYTGDGRSDIADWSKLPFGSKSHTWKAKTDGGFNAPVDAWSNYSVGWYVTSRMKNTTGDFNGDGIGDVATLYNYTDGGDPHVALLTWLGKGDGTFNDPLASWEVKSGWYFEHMTINAGDFNGDGRDDVSVWYDYTDGTDKIFTFTTKPGGGFNAPAAAYQAPAGWYNAAKMKFATGDYNADGRDDIAVFYGYPDGKVKLLTFPSAADGTFTEPTKDGWESATGWSFDRASIFSGDFNGDGRDDIATWYDYGDGHDTVIGFNPSQADGDFGNRHDMWTVPAGNYTRDQMQMATGDFNGDGLDDLATIYGYDDGTVKTITWTAKSDGNLNAPLHSWEAKTGWVFNDVNVIERYSPA